MLIEFLVNVIGNTPIWVWAVLAFIVERGWALRKDGPVNLARSCILPCIFIVWGLERVWKDFSYPLAAFGTYGLSLCVGTAAGFLLYSSTQFFYNRDGIWIRRGSGLPMVVIIMNFCIKYCFNVWMSAAPEVLTMQAFNIGYAIAAGCGAGLFLGGILNTVLHTKQVGAGI